MLGSNKKIIFSKKYQKRVQEGRVTHWEHYEDLLRGPTPKVSTWTIFEGGKKKRSHIVSQLSLEIKIIKKY